MLIGVKSGMMIDSRDNPDELLEPLAYLTRWKNRLRVLEMFTEVTLKPGLDPPGYEPRELQDQTEASEATVNRILNEFQEAWLGRTRYRRGIHRNGPGSGYRYRDHSDR